MDNTLDTPAQQQQPPEDFLGIYLDDETLRIANDIAAGLPLHSTQGGEYQDLSFSGGDPMLLHPTCLPNAVNARTMNPLDVFRPTLPPLPQIVTTTTTHAPVSSPIAPIAVQTAVDMPLGALPTHVRVHALNESSGEVLLRWGGDSVRAFSNVGPIPYIDVAVLYEFVPRVETLVLSPEEDKYHWLIPKLNGERGTEVLFTDAYQDHHLDKDYLYMCRYMNPCAAAELLQHRRIRCAAVLQTMREGQNVAPLLLDNILGLRGFLRLCRDRGITLRCDFNRTLNEEDQARLWRAIKQTYAQLWDCYKNTGEDTFDLSTNFNPDWSRERRIYVARIYGELIHHGYMEVVNKERHLFRLINTELQTLCKLLSFYDAKSSSADTPIATLQDLLARFDKTDIIILNNPCDAWAGMTELCSMATAVYPTPPGHRAGNLPLVVIRRAHLMTVPQLTHILLDIIRQTAPEFLPTENAEYTNESTKIPKLLIEGDLDTEMPVCQVIRSHDRDIRIHQFAEEIRQAIESARKRAMVSAMCAGDRKRFRELLIESIRCGDANTCPVVAASHPLPPWSCQYRGPRSVFELSPTDGFWIDSGTQLCARGRGFTLEDIYTAMVLCRVTLFIVVPPSATQSHEHLFDLLSSTLI